MWITRLNRLDRTAPGGATRRRNGGGFALGDNESTPSLPAKPNGQAVHGIEALLALQGVDTPSTRHQRTVQYGRDLLDQLEDLRLDLLAGRVGPDRIARIVDIVRRRAGTDDPHLDRLIREIELRASVELAKLGQFID